MNNTDKETLCKLCLKEIPSNRVQQGGMHLGCYEKEIEVFKICSEGTCCYDDNLPENPEEYEIEKVKMSAGIFYNMPEFEGF